MFGMTYFIVYWIAFLILKKSENALYVRCIAAAVIATVVNYVLVCMINAFDLRNWMEQHYIREILFGIIVMMTIGSIVYDLYDLKRKNKRNNKEGTP